MKRKLLLATTNQGKVKEYRSLLEGVPFEMVSPRELGIDAEVEETGQTFEENARMKASAMAERSGLITLADDSGLEVDALNGEPGVRSARYAGEGATDADRYNYLLSRMENLPWPERTARFRCVIAIAVPGGEVMTCEGECPGIIMLEPKGDNGFGYDPVFYLPDMDRTMAEISREEKNRISHRAQAAAKAKKLLQNLPSETLGSTA